MLVDLFATKDPIMDIQVLRRERELYQSEKQRIEAELDAFIILHMEEIREALAVHASGVPDITEEELSQFVGYKMQLFLSMIQREVAAATLRTQECVRRLEQLVAAEHCCRQIAGDRSAHEPDVDVSIELRTGIVRFGGMHGQYSLALGVEESEYKMTESLFSKELQTRISGASMAQHIRAAKVDAGLAVHRALCSAPEDEIRRLTSYARWRVDGFAVLGEDSLGMEEVGEEVRRVVATDFSDRKKAFLVNNLLLMFVGVSGTVDLGYFEGRDEMYILAWTRMNK